jgi:hypothetical protein
MVGSPAGWARRGQQEPDHRSGLLGYRAGLREGPGFLARGIHPFGYPLHFTVVQPYTLALPAHIQSNIRSVGKGERRERQAALRTEHLSRNATAEHGRVEGSLDLHQACFGIANECVQLLAVKPDSAAAATAIQGYVSKRALLEIVSATGTDSGHIPLLGLMVGRV